jgi:sortase (surface protein transpeptidase)
MEFLIIFGVFAGIVLLVLKVLASFQASKKANEVNLEKAWQMVLNDPNYTDRRPHEERKHEYEERARKETENL